MSDKTVTFESIFSDFSRQAREELVREDTPGTPEFARKAAFSAAHARRVSEKVALAVAAGGIIGVTHTEQGEPLATEVEEEEEEEEDELELED